MCRMDRWMYLCLYSGVDCTHAQAHAQSAHPSTPIAVDLISFVAVDVAFVSFISWAE